MKMKSMSRLNLLGWVGLTFGLSAAWGLDGSIDRVLEISEVREVKVIQQHFDPTKIANSFIEVELSGDYEAEHAPGADVFIKLDSEIPFLTSWRKHEFSLHPVEKSTAPLLITGGAHTLAVTTAKFTQRFKIQTYDLEWYTTNGKYRSLTWQVTAPILGRMTDDKKRQVTTRRDAGFRVTLDVQSGWTMEKLGFPVVD